MLSHHAFPRFQIIVPVWGADYLHVLQTFLLPSLLAPGNLPAWPHGAQTELHLLTPAPDAAKLEHSPIIQTLRHFCPVYFDLFEPETLKNWIRNQRGEVHKYNLTHVLLCQALEAAQAQSASVFPLMADMVVADGFFLFVEKLRQQGIQLLMHISPRVINSEFQALARPYFETPSCLRLSPQILARLSLQSLHPHEKACFFDAPVFTDWPSHFYLKSEQQLIAHCFHMHPLYMFEPKPLSQTAFSTIDLDYVLPYSRDLSRVYVAQNHETAACSLSHPEQDLHLSRPMTGPDRLQTLKTFSKYAAQPLHHWLFKQAVYFELEDLPLGFGESIRA